MGRGVDSADRILAQRYALEQELGRGGMGTVYLARDLKYDRPVAIKFFGADSPASEGDAARFLEEIRTAARLSHPHILPVHDSGEENGALYYVMPRVDGPSLRERMEREQRMSIPEALGITRQIAGALSYAHAHGVVHRDIKPENVLLDRQGHVWVADFGLARALSTVANTRLTRPGLTVGSPAYMSPEQVAGDDTIDGRSDLYSLGCVLFEMLAAKPPFAGERAQDVMRRHLAEAVPSLRARRADVPPQLDRIVECLLAKSPEDRYATAHDFIHDLDRLAQSSGGRIVRSSPRLFARGASALRASPIRAAIGVAAILLASLGLWALRSDLDGAAAAAASADSTTMAILPLRSGTSGGTSQHHLLLRDAFTRWQDLVVIDPMRTADAVARRGGALQLTAAEAVEAARELGVTRFVHGSEVRVGDSIQLTVGLYDAAGGGRLLRSASIRTTAREPAPLAYATLADSLLFGRATIASVTGSAIGTRSMHARGDYARGHVALENWDLHAADSLFAAAIATDADFVRAHLWLAQTRNWLGLPAEHWSNYADQAVAGEGSLTERERGLAAGLAGLAHQAYPQACADFSELVRLDRRDFAAWHGLGECLTSDEVVVPDPSTPSGFRFRASYHAGVEAFREAFRILPSSYLTVRSGGLERISDRLFTAGLKIRSGWTEGTDPQQFLAHPALSGDTLVFVPQPFDRWSASEDTDAWQRAIARQRRVLSDIARAWVVAYPTSPEAAYAQAIALDMLADPTSVSWIRRARSFEPAATRSIDLAAAHVWLEVRYGAPDTVRIAAARALADSLLAGSVDDSTTARALAPLALLLGRPAQAARLAAMFSDGGAPPAVSRPANALLAFASLGAPADNIRFYERRTIDAIRNALPLSRQARARGLVLEQPALLAFPAHVMETLLTDSMRTPAGAAQAAWLRRDTAALDSLLPRLRRQPARPADLSPEAQYARARLLAIAGDTTTAVIWLDGLLGTLRWFTLDTFERLGDAGVVGRAMALRARIAERQHDEENARVWGRAVTTLWATAEPALLASALRLDTGP